MTNPTKVTLDSESRHLGDSASSKHHVMLMKRNSVTKAIINDQTFQLESQLSGTNSHSKHASHVNSGY